MKQFFQRFIPKHGHAKEHKHLAFMGSLLKEPNLWHLNRRSVAGGVAVGLFCAFLPLPGQIPIAALLAVALKGNLFLAAGATWISNPITYFPLFYFNFRVGSAIIGQPADAPEFELTLDSIWSNLSAIGIPLTLGSLLLGLLAGMLAYFGIQLSWRYYVVQVWEKRKARIARKKRQAEEKENKL